MTQRMFVLIFVSWAALTIITPTLILLSESSKPDLDFHVKKLGVAKTRKMMGYMEKAPRTEEEVASAPTPTPTPTPVPAAAPAPAPAPEPVSGIEKTILIRRAFRRQ